MASFRSKDNPVFRYPSPFPPNCLPTKLLMLYHEQLGESTTEKYKAEHSCNSVTLDLIEIWEKATIPTMTYLSICRKVRTTYDTANERNRHTRTKTSFLTSVPASAHLFHAQSLVVQRRSAKRFIFSIRIFRAFYDQNR